MASGLTALPTIVGAIPLAIAAVAVIAIAGRFLVGPLIRLAARHGGREAVVAIALFLAVGIALLTEAVGLSTALGAFLAGILIGETEYRHQIEVDIEPFKGLLLGLFFMTVGMSFDPALLFTAFAAVVGSVIGLVLLKSAVMFPLALAFGVKRPAAAEVAVLLAGAGEFAFVVLTLARDAGLIDARGQPVLRRGRGAWAARHRRSCLHRRAAGGAPGGPPGRRRARAGRRGGRIFPTTS